MQNVGETSLALHLALNTQLYQASWLAFISSRAGGYVNRTNLLVRRKYKQYTSPAPLQTLRDLLYVLY